MDRCKPTAEEVRIHEETHMPFRGWCKWCLWGRGKEEARRAANPDDAPTVPGISPDYCFWSRDVEMDVVTILATVQNPEGPVAAIMAMQ